MQDAKALADELEALAAKARKVGLSIPGEPAWPIEQDRKNWAIRSLSAKLHDNLPSILAALRAMENNDAG